VLPSPTWLKDTDDVVKAYDSHCNLVLGDVEETIYTIEEDDDGEETVKVGQMNQDDTPSC
jgi:hypothetical protein